MSGTRGNWLLAAGGGLAWAAWQRGRREQAPSLRGQVVLITGGSRGLGLLLAREFAAGGCRVAICARDPEELRRAHADLESRGADVLALPCDVADQAQVEAMIDQVLARFGTIDVLVNNAGIIQVGPLETMTLDDFDRAMDINFRGALHTTLALLPLMRARRSGRIVNITSIGGKVAVPHLLPYDCAKFALVAFSEGMRAELAGSGIRVTTVVPGLMRTGSPFNALVRGSHRPEYAWFAVAAGTPLTAMGAGRAARRIVLATRRGEAELTLTWQATLLRVLHGLAPAAITTVLGGVARLLPQAPATPTGEVKGMEVETPGWLAPVMRPMTRTARDTHQFAARGSSPR